MKREFLILGLSLLLLIPAGALAIDVSENDQVKQVQELIPVQTPNFPEMSTWFGGLEPEDETEEEELRFVQLPTLDSTLDALLFTLPEVLAVPARTAFYEFMAPLWQTFDPMQKALFNFVFRYCSPCLQCNFALLSIPLGCMLAPVMSMLRAFKLPVDMAILPIELFLKAALDPLERLIVGVTTTSQVLKESLQTLILAPCMPCILCTDQLNNIVVQHPLIGLINLISLPCNLCIRMPIELLKIEGSCIGCSVSCIMLPVQICSTPGLICLNFMVLCNRICSEEVGTVIDGCLHVLIPQEVVKVLLLINRIPEIIYEKLLQVLTLCLLCPCECCSLQLSFDRGMPMGLDTLQGLLGSLLGAPMQPEAKEEQPMIQGNVPMELIIGGQGQTQTEVR